LPLNDEETTALETFAALGRQFDYGPHWLGRPVAKASSEEQALSDSEKLTGPDHAKTLRDVFRVMEPRFARIWERDEGCLMALAVRLEVRLHSEGVAPYIQRAARGAGHWKDGWT